MNQKDALKILRKKKKYIDDDVFQTLGDHIKRDLEKEHKKFNTNAKFLIDNGIDADVLKNIILSSINDPSLLLHKY